jgi:hypothetical protein
VTWRVLALLVAASAAAAPTAAQVDPSLGVGAGTVRFEGGSSFSSAAFSPELRYAASRFSADFSGSLASLPQGIWATQGRLDLWGVTRPLSDGLALSAEAILSGTTRSDSGRTAADHGLLELVRSRARWGMGIGLGPSGGWISNLGWVAALHTRGRAWWRSSAGVASPEWQVSIEPTRFPDGWFTDATAAVSIERGPAALYLWTGARLSGVYGSTAAGNAFLQVFLAPAWSLELGGGSYLRDPYQGLPRAAFVNIGLRVHGRRHAPSAAPAVRQPPLVPAVRGDSLVVRFRMERAHSVAIAGDWNAWQPGPLQAVGDDVWEGTLALARGLYHFNLLVDGTDWVVPNGVAVVPDGLGGMVAVLVVP